MILCMENLSYSRVEQQHVSLVKKQWCRVRFVKSLYTEHMLATRLACVQSVSTTEGQTSPLTTSHTIDSTALTTRQSVDCNRQMIVWIPCICPLSMRQHHLQRQCCIQKLSLYLCFASFSMHGWWVEPKMVQSPPIVEQNKNGSKCVLKMICCCCSCLRMFDAAFDAPGCF